MTGRVVLTIIGVFALVIILYSIFKSDDDINTSKDVITIVNICKQREEQADHLVANYLNNLYLNDNFTDIELIARNGTVRGHKLILAAHSKYLESMIRLDSKTNETGISQFVIAKFDQKSLVNALHYMYTGHILPDILDNENDYSNLLRVATELQIDPLICEISKRLTVRINQKTVSHILALAEETNATYLMTFASNYLFDHFKEVRETSEWSQVVNSHQNILANVIDFHGKLPNNSSCDIQCEMATVTSPSIYKRLHAFFLTQEFADAEVRVVVGNDMKVFRVNRAILISQSPIFRKQFADSPDFIIIEASTNVTKEFLNYMYTGWPQQLNNFAMGLLHLSNIYGMESLKTECEDIIYASINIENAAKIAEISNEVHSKRLSSRVLDFILSHRKEVVATKAWADLKETNPEALTHIFEI